VKRPQDKVKYQQNNCRGAAVPEETHDEVKDLHNDVQKIAQDDEYNHKRNCDPNPCPHTR